MAICHDAYQFDPAAFAQGLPIAINDIGCDPCHAYNTIRDAALVLMEKNNSVRDMLDIHGGWDLTSVKQELPTTWRNDPDDISFCLTILLYGHLEAIKSYGLKTSSQRVAELLRGSGWGETERNLLIRGYDFGVLCDRYIADHCLKTTNSVIAPRRVCEKMRPVSIGSSAGWLSYADVTSLKDHLQKEKDGIRLAFQNSDDSMAFQMASEMLEHSIASNTGLCIIVSG